MGTEGSFLERIQVAEWTVEYFQQNPEHCLKYLQSCDLDVIPLLNRSTMKTIKDGQLVRYHGMIQDMLNPEFFYESYDIRNDDTNEIISRSGMYRDVVQCKANEEFKIDTEKAVPKERQPLFCIAVPGMNKWAQKDSTQVMISEPGPSKTAVNKRSLEEAMETDNSEENCAKRLNTTPETSSSLPSTQHSVLENNNELSCIVKIYSEDTHVVLNDIICVVGFVSVDPNLSVVEGNDETSNPPPSLVPRLHAVIVNKLLHMNPLLDQQIVIASAGVDCQKIRSELHLTLTQLLFGDILAAEYLICHLLSRIYVKQECLKIGHFSLNLSGIKCKEYSKQLYELLALMTPQSSYLPLNIQHMNTTRFIPKKDYTTNKLQSGVLQMAQDTQLVIDETQLEEGQLNDMGCRNMAALHCLVTQQHVKYDFSFYNIDYDTDIRVLVLSEGKSLIPVKINLKIKADPDIASTINETFEAAKFYLNNELLNQIRKYLTAMKLQEFEISDEVMKIITEDFVNMRQENKKMTQDDLHTLLVLARLVALSKGEVSLTSLSWNQAKQMESERKARLS